MVLSPNKLCGTFFICSNRNTNQSRDFLSLKCTVFELLLAKDSLSFSGSSKEVFVFFLRKVGEMEVVGLTYSVCLVTVHQ